MLNICLIGNALPAFTVYERILWIISPYIIGILVVLLAKMFEDLRSSASNISVLFTIVCYFTLLLIHQVQLWTLFLYSGIGFLLAWFTVWLVLKVKRKTFSSAIFVFMGASTLFWTIWNYPSFSPNNLLWICGVSILPILSFVLMAPNYQFSALARLLGIAQLNIAVWVAPIVLFGLSSLSQVPWYIFLLSAFISGLIVFTQSSPKWAENEWFWYGKGSQSLFPFKMRKQEHNLSNFHLVEITKEPPASVVASKATVWVFRNSAGAINRLLLSGHANLPICREVSSKLYTTLIELGPKVEASLLVPGAFEVKINPSLENEPNKSIETNSPMGKLASFLKPVGILDELFHQLQQMEIETGLVEIRELDEKGKDGIHEKVLSEVRNFQWSKKDKLLIAKGETQIEDVAFMPFYSLKLGDFEPISIDIETKFIEGPEFDYLINRQRLSLILEMTRDAHRRKQVYTEWLSRDEDSLRRLAYDMFSEILPSLTVKQMEGLLVELTKLTVNALQTMPLFLQTDNLGKFIVQRQVAASRVDVRALLQQYHVFNDREWNEKIQPFKITNIPVQGVRNYLEATLGEVGKINKYISRLELIEGHLPGLIQTDHEWINKMDELIAKFEKKDDVRDERIQKINLETFLDSFLRGWPSFFLEDEKSQQIYQNWCNNRREVVWRAIRSKLAEIEMRIEPIIEDNVVFRVQRLNSELVRITPLCLVTNRDLGLLLSRRVGATYYINFWQRRNKIWREQPVSLENEKNDKKSKRLASLASQKLQDANIADAVTCFRDAIRTHPYVGSNEIITNYWSIYSNTNKEFLIKTKLVQALHLFNKDRSESAKLLTEFIQEYPDYLPDPYLFLSVSRKLKSTQVEESSLQRLTQEYSSLLEGLIREGVLTPVNPEASHLQGSQSYAVHLSPWDRDNNERIKHLSSMQAQLEAKRSSIQKNQEHLWKSLPDKTDDNYAHAMSINPDYVNQVVAQKMLFTSMPHAQVVGSILSSLRADEYLNLFRSLAKASQLVDELKQNIPTLLRTSKELQNVRYLSIDEISGLVDLQRTLESMQDPDSIEREMVLRGKIDQLKQNYIFNAYRGYQEALALSEFSQIRQKYALCLFYMARYRRSLEVLLKPPLLPVSASFTHGKFSVVDFTPYPVKGFRLTDDKICIQDDQHSFIPIVSFKGLSDLERNHLETEIGKTGFFERFSRFPLNPAYAFLSTPIAPSPMMLGWVNAISDIQLWLLYTMAYAGVLPLRDTEPSLEAIEAFQLSPILENVIIDKDQVIAQLMSEIGANPTRIAKEFIN